MSDPRKRSPFKRPDFDPIEDDMSAENLQWAENVVDDDMGTQYDTADYGGADDGNTVYSDADPGL